MPNKNRTKRQQEEEAELNRRRAQSQRDKARHRREEADRERAFERAFARYLAQESKPTQPATKPTSSTVFGDNLSKVLQASIMEARSKKFMGDIARMFNDTKYSDATIIIYNVTLPVHRFVVCTQSEYFQKAFQAAFIEGSSGELIFNEGSGAAHWRVFEYLYTGDYSDPPPNNLEDDPPLLKDPRVYALADMFFLEDLKSLSVLKLQQRLQESWRSDSFPECVREIYATTPDSDRAMRSAVVNVARAHTYDLGKKATFRDLLREGGDFAVDFTFPNPLT